MVTFSVGAKCPPVFRECYQGEEFKIRARLFLFAGDELTQKMYSRVKQHGGIRCCSKCDIAGVRSERGIKGCTYYPYPHENGTQFKY